MPNIIHMKLNLLPLQLVKEKSKQLKSTRGEVVASLGGIKLLIDSLSLGSSIILGGIESSREGNTSCTSQL